MRIHKHDIPTAIDVPGATARQLGDFGDSDGCCSLAAEYFSLGAGTDIAPLLQGLVRVVDVAEVILFSPHAQHAAVMDHVRAVMAG